MSKIISALIITFLLASKSMCQDAEKSISNQSILIDAIKEEQIGNVEKAFELFVKLKYFPETKGASNYYLSRIYRSQGKYDEAMSAIEQSIESEPKNKWYLILKANLAEDFGQFEIIAQVYQILSQLEPNNYTYYDISALNYLKAENPQNALSVMDKAQTIFGLLPPIAIKKSNILVFQKKSKKAIELLEECLIQYPDHSELIDALLRIAQDENNSNLLDKYNTKNKASTQNKKIMPVENDLIQMINSAAFSLDDKIKALFQQLTIYINDANTTGIQSLIPYATELIRQQPSNPKPQALLADLYFQLDDLWQASRYYSQSVSLGLVPYSVWENLLNCLISLHHWKALLHYSDLCLDFYPAQSLVSYTQLLAAFQLNKSELSVNDMKSLLLKTKSNPLKHTNALLLAARIYKSQNLVVEADSAWQQALRINFDGMALLEYGLDLSIENGKVSETIINKILNTNKANPAYKSFKLASIYFNLKDFTNAKNYLEESLKFPISKNREIFLLAASIYEALGDNQQANLYFLQANEFSEEKQTYPYRIQSK